MAIFLRSNIWRIIVAVFMLVIVGFGIVVMIQDYYAGYPFWWHNSASILFGFAILGLLYVVREGLQAFQNYDTYGRDPENAEAISEISSESTHPEDIIDERTYEVK